MPPTPLSDMTCLLDKERQMLRNGNFVGLTALQAEKTDMLERLLADTTAQDPAALTRLRRTAAENLNLLSSVRAGLRAGQRRLAEIRALADGPHIYDMAGMRKKLPGQTPKRSETF